MTTPLQRERAARGPSWTQSRVAEELTDLAWQLGHGEVGIDANAVSRHERGVIKRPRAPLPELYAALYKTTIDTLWPGFPHGTLDSSPEARRAQVRRRQFIRSAGGVAVGLAGGRLLATDPDAILERVRHTTTRYRGDDEHRPASELIGPVLRHVRHLDRLSHQHPHLAAAASEAASYAAWLFVDLDNQATARGYYRTAIRLAEQAGSSTLHAYQLGSLAQLAADTGHGIGALRLAGDAADRIRPDAPTVAHGWVAATQALAHATVRDVRAAMAALDHAEAAGEGRPDWPWIRPFSADKLAAYRGQVEIRLQRPQAAQAALITALAARTAPTKERAVLLVHLAATYARADTNEAARLLGEAYSIAAAKKSEKVARRVLAVRRRLDPKANAVRQLDQQLLTGWL